MHGWVITKVNTEFLDESEVGTMGPYDTPFNLRAEIQEAGGQRFRMLDDDGEEYYQGYCVVPGAKVVQSKYKNLAKVEGEDWNCFFAPLWDFGTPNAGATDIEYWIGGPGGGWKGL